MALQVIKEITEWKVDFRQPNHVYLMDGSKVVAYQPWGEGEPVYYTNKQKLDKRRRQFETVPLKQSPFQIKKCLTF
jgi:hypothetical protein